MSELEDKLSSLLSDPAEMEKLMGMAKTISASLGGESGGPAERGEPEDAAARLVSRLMHASPASDKAALLNAMKPYLREDRRQLIDKAARLARMAGIAKLAMSEMSGGDDLV